MLQKLSNEFLDKLKAQGLYILSLNEYKEIINQWGFDIHLDTLKNRAAANSDTINGVSFQFFTSAAVLTEKLKGKVVCYANVAGYEIIGKDDPKRKAFQEFRRAEPFFIYAGKIWKI